MIMLNEAGKKDEIVQETRGWDENNQKTFSQRKKESSDDYRYFPEPDLPKLYLHELFDLEEIKGRLPEIPAGMRTRFTEQYGLSAKEIEIYVQNKHLAELFEAVALQTQNPAALQKGSNLILSDVVYFLDTEDGATLPRAETFASIVGLFADDQITSRGVKDLLRLSMTSMTEIEPESFAKEHGMIQQSNTDDLRPLVEKIIADNPGPVAEYRAGKESVLQFFLGQIMKETKGSANPKLTTELLKELLK